MELPLVYPLWHNLSRHLKSRLDTSVPPLMHNASISSRFKYCSVIGVPENLAQF